MRLAEDSHNCWGTCEDNAAEMLEALKLWADVANSGEKEEIPTTAKLKFSDSASSVVEVTEPGVVAVEAESGVTGGAMIVTENPNASGAGFVYTPNNAVDVDRIDDPAASPDTITYTVEVKDAGLYQVFGRSSAPAGADNSFFVSLDGGPFVNWTLPITMADEFVWGMAPVEAVQLAPGPHTIEIRRREAGSMLDVLALAIDPEFAGTDNVGAAEVNVLTFDASELCGAPGTTLEVAITDHSETSYAISKPKVISEVPLRVEGIQLQVNGIGNDQYSTFSHVAADVNPGDQEPLVASGAIIALKEEGIENDTFSFLFDVCRPL